MSLLGKIFAILNVFAAVGFVVIAGMDYSQRHRWAYSVYRHQLLVDGLPIDEAEKDADGVARVKQFDEPWFNEMFARAGGNPVKTQQAELQNLQNQVQARVNNADDKGGNKTQKLARFVNALAETYAQRKAALRQMGPAGTKPDDISPDLSTAYAHILDPKGMTRGGHDIIMGIRDKAAGPLQPGEIAARVPYTEQAPVRRQLSDERLKQLEEQKLIELQVGRDPVVFALAPELAYSPKDKDGTEVFLTLKASTADKLQEILTADFAAAGQGSAGARKAAAARIIFCISEAMLDEPNSDFFTSPGYQRLAIVAGLSGATQTVNTQAVAYRRMIQEYISDYQGGAMGDHDFDLRQFVGEHNQIVANTVGLAESAENLKQMLRAKEADVAKQKLLVQKRQTEIDDLRKRLNDKSQDTANKLAEQARAEQEVRDRLIELRDTGRINQQLEREIRQREEEGAKP